MMHSIRSIFAVVLAGLALTAAVGCGGGNSAPAGPALTEAPMDVLLSWYIDGTYPLAERIGLENGVEFDRSAAECFADKTGKSAAVSFPARDGSGALKIGARRSAEGELELDLSGPYFEIAGYGEETEELVEQISSWDKLFRDELITVTPEDIVNAGCTETSGSGYMNAVYRCFAEKLAERYLGLADDAPGACSFAQVISVEDSDLGDGLICIAVSPKDLVRFIIHVDLDYGFVIDSASDFYGKLFIAGFAPLTRQPDGSWVGRSELTAGA